MRQSPRSHIQFPKNLNIQLLTVALHFKIHPLKMLHCQMRELQKDIKLLDKLLKHQKHKNNEEN